MFTLPKLPFDLKALEPQISARTLEFHYGKHHQAYVDNLNKLIAGTGLEGKKLEEVITISGNDPEKAGIFNNAAQHFNHSFFWNCLALANAKAQPDQKTLDVISDNFGSLDSFLAEFRSTALAVFGSGWIWLVKDGGDLKIMKTANGDNPIAHKLEPVWTLDVWEHAYYLDYQNRRADFVDAVLKNLINWEFVSKNL